MRSRAHVYLFIKTRKMRHTLARCLVEHIFVSPEAMVKFSHIIHYYYYYFNKKCIVYLIFLNQQIFYLYEEKSALRRKSLLCYVYTFSISLMFQCRFLNTHGGGTSVECGNTGSKRNWLRIMMMF